VTRYTTVHTIGLREQIAWMRLIHPEFSCHIEPRNGRKALICRGSVQPTPVNDAYQARIEYAIPAYPMVFIESPKLQRRNEDERIPHTYAGDRPCLYRRDFNSEMRIATTIVPWLMYWLMFYEGWLVTGEWQGGGEHPGPMDTELAA
jgi:hypothetical protein